MGEWLDTPGEVLAVLSIVAIISGALLFLIKSQVALTRQAQPNGGSSLRDAFDRLEASVGDIHADVREIRATQQAHMDWHLTSRED
jgi:hypothetical protein